MSRETTSRCHARRAPVGRGTHTCMAVTLAIVVTGAITRANAQDAPPPRQTSAVVLVSPRLGPADSDAIPADGAILETGELRIIHFRSVLAAFWMRRAVKDAARRFQQPDCRLLLTDFTDESGNLLSANLSRLGMTPAEFVERGLIFVDGSDERPCLTDLRAAFTSPGSRVIFVCASRLLQPNSEPSPRIGLLIIHEALHALGLGENPPPSAGITRQVGRRCGS
jgi:hypothetical protein